MQIARNDRIILTELPDGTGVLLDLDSKFYYSLNATGVFLWKCLEAGTTETDVLATSMSEHFEVEPEQAIADIAVVLEDLRREQLVA